MLWYGCQAQPYDYSQITTDVVAALRTLCPDDLFDFGWYKNPKMSIPEYYHVHVFWHRLDGMEDGSCEPGGATAAAVGGNGEGMDVGPGAAGAAVAAAAGPLQLSINAVETTPSTKDVVITVTPSESLRRRGVDLCCCVDVSGSMADMVSVQNAQGETESHGLNILDIVKHSYT